MKRPLESAFQRKFLKKLKTLKCCWFFKSSDRVRNGIPDVIVCKVKFWVKTLMANQEHLTKPDEGEEMRDVQDGGIPF